MTSGVFSVGNEPARVEVEGCQRPSEHAVAPIYSFSFLSSLIQQNSWDQSQFRFQHLNPHFITNTHQEIWFKNQLTFVIDITAVAHKLLQRMKGQVSNFVNHVVRISWMKLSDSCKQNLFFFFFKVKSLKCYYQVFITEQKLRHCNDSVFSLSDLCLHHLWWENCCKRKITNNQKKDAEIRKEEDPCPSRLGATVTT